MTTLHAQPYDMTTVGFYFDSYADYRAKASELRNDYGDPFEEFEIQFIEGEGIDCQLFTALHIYHGAISNFFDAVAEWSREDKIKVIITAGEPGYHFNLGSDNPNRLDVDLYEFESMSELASQFLDDGIFGEIPPALQNYIDVDAIAYDLAMDYAQIMVDGTNYIYRYG